MTKIHDLPRKIVSRLLFLNYAASFQISVQDEASTVMSLLCKPLRLNVFTVQALKPLYGEFGISNRKNGNTSQIIKAGYMEKLKNIQLLMFRKRLTLNEGCCTWNGT